MLRAYRLIITHYEYAPPQLWEWEQPHIDNLSLSARTFGHHMKQRFFMNEDALDRDNTRIWHTHYNPKPAHDHIANWQELLAEHRQVIIVVSVSEDGISYTTTILVLVPGTRYKKI